MNGRLGRPLPESLPVEIARDGKQTPQDLERHVKHNGFDEPALRRPWRDEFREPVAPQILVHGDGDEDRAGDGLIRVDGIGADDGGDGGDLDAGRSVADNDDRLRLLG